ncbi:MAG: hypothetical protein ACU84Q_00385 [Gammaproteobacteria bacterium]
MSRDRIPATSQNLNVRFDDAAGRSTALCEVIDDLTGKEASIKKALAKEPGYEEQQYSLRIGAVD